MAIATAYPFGARSPFNELRRLQSDINRLFETPSLARGNAALFPPVNLWLGDNSVVVTAELPGVAANELQLTLEDRALTIKGERGKVADNEVAWHRRERPTGSFARTIQLPFAVDPDKVEARFDNGVLVAELQRPESDRPRKIAVNA